MDTIAEQLDTAEEFNQAISQPLPGNMDKIEEEDLEEELSKLQDVSHFFYHALSQPRYL